MKIWLLLAAVLAILSLPVRGQERNAQHGGSHADHGGGYIPKHGPPPAKAQPRSAPATEHGAPAAEHRTYADQPGHPEAPHVHTNGKWVGHDGGRDNANYHLDHPGEHGRFTAGTGGAHASRLAGGTGSASGSAASTSAWPPMTS